jgi:hypothetical protein
MWKGEISMNKENAENEALMTELDAKLREINATLSMANEIRAMCEKGAVADDLYEHVKNTLKVGIRTKESILNLIQETHKEIARYHVNMTHEGPTGAIKWL